MLNRSTAKASKAVSSIPLENLESRRLMTSTYDIGINMNDSASATVAKVTPILKDLGVKTLRIWSGVSDFNSRKMTGALQRTIDYSNAGFDVTLIVANDDGKVHSAASVAGWFQWAASNPALKNAVDRWEIGNEPDAYKYWNGTLAQYVSNFLKPAYESLHAAGEEVVSAGPSWNPADVQTMIDAGMLDYTDYVGFHPYARGVSGVKKTVEAINAVVAGRKPIAATEWNVRGLEGNKTAWAQAVQEAYPYIKNGFALNYYFAMKTQNSMAGPGGILNNSLAPNQPFYNAFASFSGGTGTGGGGGNDPSSATGKITGTLWEDLDADGVWDGGEAATGSRVVFIDANANGKIDSGEKSVTSNAAGVYTFTGLAAGSYKVSRVFPAGFKLSNNTAGYVTAAVKAGATTANVNLGTTKIKTVTPPTPPTVTAPAVTAFRLIDATTGKTITGYGNVTKNVTISLASLPHTNIALEAIGNSKVASMKLTALGKTIIENNAPYAFFTDAHGVYSAWKVTKGSYTISGTAYSADNAAGTKGNTLSVTLTFA